MSQDFKPGDFLIYQIESAFGLLRILAIDGETEDSVWHVAAYSDMYLDIDSADAAIESNMPLEISHPHLALTKRAFESTQTAKMNNRELNENEMIALNNWRIDPLREVSDRSVRLLLGIR